MVWIKDAPSPEAKDEDHIAFFEKVVSCSIPDADEDPELHEIVTSVQCHSKHHSRTCFKRRDDECRFGYPLPIATSTFVLRPLSAPEGVNEKNWKERAAEIVKSVKDFLTETKDIESYSVQGVLAACNVTEDKYRQALGALCRRDQLILKRDPSEVWVNFYCPKLTVNIYSIPMLLPNTVCLIQPRRKRRWVTSCERLSMKHDQATWTLWKNFAILVTFTSLTAK